MATHLQQQMSSLPQLTTIAAVSQETARYASGTRRHAEQSWTLSAAQRRGSRKQHPFSCIF